MPAAYSHYRLGQLVLDKLNQPLKRVLETNQDLFDIGLHGPDILLFYNRPYIHSKINRLGSAMHKERADIFFYQALGNLKRNQKVPHNLLIFVVSSVTTFLIVTATRILIRLSKKLV